ncbi:WD repeat-containing protein 3 [Halotydeus destructor]|nr:WD repeat-containing protein 3 [Halotydeus destructor]
MPITQQYLRWVSAGLPFGVIASTNGQTVFIELNGIKDRFVAVSACENVIIWDTKTGERVKLLKGDKADSTSLAQDSRTALISCGYSDGSIRIYNYHTGELKVTFQGHKSAVSSVAFDSNGMRLASGGKDTEIVLWDVVGETGLFRLKGHKGAITNLQFMKDKPDILLSSSKDTYFKFWDLQTQHCFKTLVGHRSEIWDFVYLDTFKRLITGASDNELRVWELEFIDSSTNSPRDSAFEDDEEKHEQDDEEKHEQDDDESTLIVRKRGSVLRKSASRLVSMNVDSNDRFMVCHGTDAIVECFRFRTQEEVNELMQKRLKRERKRLKRAHAGKGGETEIEVGIEKTLTDEIECFEPFKASSKVKYCGVTSKNATCKIVSLLSGNAIEMHSKFTPTSFAPCNSLKLDGHRTDVRTLCFSSDNYFILSASADSVKIWSRASQRCIATMAEECGYALCSLFVPGDKACLIGTKEGDIHIYDIGSSTRLERIEASATREAIWSMDMYPNGKGIVTGSEDKTVKFWDFEFVSEGKENARRLTLVHKRTLQMDESVLCLKLSPNEKFVAVSLADSTVKIFFVDTLKFFLSLYGHKFPVICMDISYDSHIIATGSSDKNIKLWGLDFGDCHKSIFAHDDTITCLRFVNNTHYLYSCSKDKTIKQWDADNFEKIITLVGHQAEVWSLAVSPNGKLLVSASHDKSLRLWEKTAEPLILEEEQEMEREEQFEKNAFVGDDNVVAGETNEETGLAGRKTIETLKATELLMEAVDVHREERAALSAHAARLRIARSHGTELPQPPVSNPIMGRFNTSCPDRFVLESLRKIKSSELDEALLSLPFGYVQGLLSIIADLMAKGWEVELLLRCVTFLTRIHFGQITSSATLLPVIDKLRNLTVDRSKQFKDLVGFNLAGLRYMQSKMEEGEEVCLFDEAFANRKNNKKKKKRKEHEYVLRL